MSGEDATKLGILRAQLKQRLITDGLLSEDTQLILDNDIEFKFEYRTGVWYTGTINYVMVYHTTQLPRALAGYQLVTYQIQ